MNLAMSNKIESIPANYSLHLSKKGRLIMKISTGFLLMFCIIPTTNAADQPPLSGEDSRTPPPQITITLVEAAEASVAEVPRTNSIRKPGLNRMNATSNLLGSSPSRADGEVSTSQVAGIPEVTISDSLSESE